MKGGVMFCRRGYPWGVEAAREVLWVPAKQEDGYSRAELPVMREGQYWYAGYP